MDFKALKWQIFRGSIAWRYVFRGMFFVLAMIVLSFTRIIANEIRSYEPILLNFDKCSLNVGSNINTELRVSCVDGKNLTVTVIKELMKIEKLSLDSKALCVGKDSDSIAFTLRKLGFLNAISVHKNPILSLFRKQFEHKLDFNSDSFDFVFSTSSYVPALIVLEIERVLQPGGVGAMLVGPTNFHTRSLVRSATPVSLLIRNSEILHVCGINSFTLIVFKKQLKQLQNAAFFDNFKFPNECPSIIKNKPFMNHLEPVDESHELSYLPEYLNVSSRNRFIYINMGSGEFDKRYPIHPDAFNVYIVDHNVSALTSLVKNPGVTFVYHPGLIDNLIENDKTESKTESSLAPVDYLEAPLHEEQFEFVDWFKETAKDGDFVVLMMNAEATQMKVLVELFSSGAICHVDEMFLKCSDGVDCGSLYHGLRNAGVFVHRWLGN